MRALNTGGGTGCAALLAALLLSACENPGNLGNITQDAALLAACQELDEMTALAVNRWEALPPDDQDVIVQAVNDGAFYCDPDRVASAFAVAVVTRQTVRVGKIAAPLVFK